MDDTNVGSSNKLIYNGDIKLIIIQHYAGSSIEKYKMA